MQQTSMTEGAVGEVVELRPRTGRSKRATAQRKRTRPIELSKAQTRTAAQFIAAIAAAFLPLASYVMAHFETQERPLMWGLVAAALLFSAPTLVDWARRWCGSDLKAVGFTVLLEGCMVFSGTTALGIAGLLILMAINCNSAWHLAGRFMRDQARAARAAAKGAK